MKKLIASVATTAALTAALTLGAMAPAGADKVGPCNRPDASGAFTGANYAADHIVPRAKDGELGNDGHKPGEHKGFSACNPSGK